MTQLHFAYHVYSNQIVLDYVLIDLPLKSDNNYSVYAFGKRLLIMPRTNAYHTLNLNTLI
jgi:hypothetical protein